MKPTSYNLEWQHSRLKFIMSRYPKEFFNNKTILELAPFNGYIGACFSELGAKVTCVEGRQENVDCIRRDYPMLDVKCANLDTDQWNWGHYDIIINFGLLYHLEHYHEAHLTNCVNHCKLTFLESVIFDSFNNEIYFRNEVGNDQSLTERGGTPSTSFVESILSKNSVDFEKFSTSELNGSLHHYNWKDNNSKVYDPFARRFWIIQNDKVQSV